jgi:hypothetical protein
MALYFKNTELRRIPLMPLKKKIIQKKILPNIYSNRKPKANYALTLKKRCNISKCKNIGVIRR